MRRTARLLLLGLLLLLSGALPIGARGQQAPAQSASPKQKPSQQGATSTQAVSSKQSSPQQKANPGAQQNIIRKQVNEITTPVTVTDRHGNFILDVPQRDFHVFDNGVEQQIDRWSLDDRPLALALVIETSSRIDMMAREIRSTGIVFTQMVMGENGAAAVISAGDKAEVKQPFTNDRGAAEKAVEGIRFEDDGLRLYDAMWEGALLLEKQPDTCHRVLLVIAEAQDGGSKHKLGQILAQAQRANISIYTIGLSSTAADLRDNPVKDAASEEGEAENIPEAADPTARPGVPEGVGGGMDFLGLAVFLVQRVTHIRKSHAMQAAVISTGGAYYHPFKDHSISNALDAIGHELHSQYVLSYQLQGPAQPGIHEIEVRVARPHVIVRARLGYYLAPTTN